MADSLTSEQPTRIDWIDYAKGIGIFLVVVGHVIRGLMGTPVQLQGGLKFVDTWIYSFHMPLFFFLSGLFAPRSARKSAITFLITKFRTIFYPYVVWSGVVGILRVISGQGKKSWVEFCLSFWTVIYQPTDIFWFLYALFLMAGLFFLLSKAKVPSLLILLGSLLFYGLTAFFPEFFVWSPLNRVATYFIYFVAGTMAFEQLAVANPQLLSLKFIATLNHLAYKMRGVQRRVPHIPVVSLSEQCHKSRKIWLGMTIFLGLVILTGASLTGLLITVTPNLILSFVGITASLCLALLCAEINGTQFIRTWGLFSLQIYVAHTAVAALVRVLLFRLFKIDSVLIHVVLETIVGLYIPLLLAVWTQKRYPYLFFIPKRS